MIILACSKHRDYKVIRKPKDCEVCCALWRFKNYCKQLSVIGGAKVLIGTGKNIKFK